MDFRIPSPLETGRLSEWRRLLDRLTTFDLAWVRVRADRVRAAA